MEEFAVITVVTAPLAFLPHAHPTLSSTILGDLNQNIRLPLGSNGVIERAERLGPYAERS